MKNITFFFYILFGVTATALLLTLSYLILHLNSDLNTLISHNSRSFLFSYGVLTLCGAVLFGLNTTFLVYLSRRYGMRHMVQGSENGVGAIIGLIASSCPICGSTILSGIGIVGSLSTLPFQGLEIKSVSLLLMFISFVQSLILFRKYRKCNDGSCKREKSDILKKSEWALPIVLIIVFLASIFISYDLYQSEKIHEAVTSISNPQQQYVCKPNNL